MQITEYISSIIIPSMCICLFIWLICLFLSWIFITRPLDKFFSHVRLKADYKFGMRSFEYCRLIVFSNTVKKNPYYQHWFGNLNFRKNFSWPIVIIAFLHFYSLIFFGIIAIIGLFFPI